MNRFYISAEGKDFGIIRHFELTGTYDTQIKKDDQGNLSILIDEVWIDMLDNSGNRMVCSGRITDWMRKSWNKYSFGTQQIKIFKEKLEEKY
jgi:hypothetical protein